MVIFYKYADSRVLGGIGILPFKYLLCLYPAWPYIQKVEQPHNRYLFFLHTRPTTHKNELHYLTTPSTTPELKTPGLPCRFFIKQNICISFFESSKVKGVLMGIKERKLREKKERYDMIMAAAKKVFLSKGFFRTTVEQIANEAEISPGTLYLYFNNKEELHTLLSVEILKSLTREIVEVNRQQFSPEEKLYNLKKIFIKTYESDPMLLINLFHMQSGDSLKNISEKIINDIKKTSSRSLGVMASIIEEGINNGVFIERHPVAVADIIWSTYSGVVLWVNSKHLLNNEKNFVKQTLNTAFEIIVKGLKH